jgi:hypothetical protein
MDAAGGRNDGQDLAVTERSCGPHCGAGGASGKLDPSNERSA